MTTQFQPGEYLTRDGNKARVYAADGGDQSLHGAILLNGKWYAHTWNADGSWASSPNPADLIPPKQVRWVNVYPEGFCESRDVADRFADPSRIACIRIEFTEGQYDD